MARGGKRPGAGRPAGSENTDTAAARAALSELASGHVEVALSALAEIASSGQSEAARVSASCAILDRAYGKPGQAVEMSGQTTGPSRIVLTSPGMPDLSKLSDAALAEIVALSDDAQMDT